MAAPPTWLAEYEAFLREVLGTLLDGAPVELVNYAAPLAHETQFPRAVWAQGRLTVVLRLNETWIRTLPYILVDALVARHGRGFEHVLTAAQTNVWLGALRRSPLLDMARLPELVQQMLRDEHANSGPIIADLALGRPIDPRALRPLVFVFDLARPVGIKSLWRPLPKDLRVDAFDALAQDVAHWVRALEL